MSMNRQEVTSWKIALPVTIVFACLGAAGILHHEMWLDETHHWLLALDSSSFSEMVFNARYEGHPLLWNALLFILAQFTSEPIWMQLLNVIIATMGALLFLRHAPFRNGIKIAVVFSYFIFYEYTVISRNYALVFLLLVIACILFRERKKHFIWLSLVLALLAQAHLFSAVISGGFLLLLAHEFFFFKERIPAFLFFSGMSIVILSLLLVVIQVIPPIDHFLYSYDHDAYLSFKRIGKALSVLWKGFFPLPDFASDHPWNSNLVISISKNLAILPAALAWLVPVILLRRKKAAIFFFYFTAACIVFFIFYSPLIVASRHCGIFFLLLIAALWIAVYFPEAPLASNRFLAAFGRLSGKVAKPLMFCLLAVQVIGGIYLYATDYKRPFSNAKAVAYWLDSRSFSREFIIVNDHTTGPPVSAYLQENVFYAEGDSLVQQGSFCKWNTKPFVIPQDTLSSKISALFYRQKDLYRIFLVSSRKVDLSQFANHSARPIVIEELKSFEGALVKAENYWVYEISKK